MAGEEIFYTILSLFIVVTAESIFLLFIMLKTPALKFLKASFGKRMMLIHETENHYIEFVPSLLNSNLAYIKGRGFYTIDPKDVKIDRISKIPITTVYGNMGRNINIKMADFADRLQQMGLKNWKEFSELKEKLAKEGKNFEIPIAGESVDSSDALDYFNTSDRSDLLEAEIQRRTAAALASISKQTQDLLKYGGFILMVLIGAAVAFAIVMQVWGNNAGGSNIITQAAQTLTGTTLPAGQGIGVG